MDFGIAMFVGRDQGREEDGVVGTVPYMSPEQARGEELDGRSDIWSYAVVLYEMISGSHPFTGLYAHSLLYQIMHEDPVPLSELRAETPERLLAVVQKGMNRNLDMRYQTAAEVIEDLEEVSSVLNRGGIVSQRQRTAQGRVTVDRERRYVTVLFLRVTGLDSLAGNLDPEITSGVTGECMKGFVSISEKFRGTTDRTLWNDLMVVFGAPIAYENSQERAIRCALELVEYAGQFNALHATGSPLRISLHLGIHSGLVIAGVQEGDRDQKYSILGETVNIAAGIVEQAADNEILISAESYRAVSRLVDAEAPRKISVRGTNAPVIVHRVLQAISAEESGIPREGLGRFIGRRNELEILRNAAEAFREKNMLVFMRGEPGVGKSRLKLEFRRTAGEARLNSFEGRCSSFELQTPYYLWNTLLKSLLRVGMDVRESELRSRLHHLAQLLSLESEEPYLAALLSMRYEQILLETDQSRKRRIFEAALHLLQEYSRRGLTAFILEDLQWIDPFSQELLDFFFEQEAVAPAFMCFIFRPEYHKLDGHFGGGILLDLDRLNAGEEEDLVRLRLGVKKIPPPLMDVVRLRADGNPFFIEEILKTLVDQRLVRVEEDRAELLTDTLAANVPETIQGVIMARIDQLEGHLREVLFNASVIGREFSRPVLERVIQGDAEITSDLRELQALDFILEKDEAREFEYLFKHYLLQEVAYNTLLLEKRKRLHGLIARTIETLYSENLKPFYELLSFHFEKAEEWDKAAEYLNRAGRKVREIYTREEAKQFYARKDIALEKLYESAGARRGGWRLLGFLTAVISAPIALFMLAAPFLMIRILADIPPHIKLKMFGSGFAGVLAFAAYVSFILLVYPWIGLGFLFFGVIPFVRGRPRSYDLLEDSLRVVLANGRSFSISFGEIAETWYYDPVAKASRPLLAKIVDPFFRVADYKSLSFRIWARKVFLNVLPPYSFGFGARQGEIIICRKTGVERLRQLLPFLNTAKRSRVLGLSPADPKEFYEQMGTAMQRWRSRTP